MPDGALVPPPAQPTPPKPKKAPEFGRPLDLPGSGNAGWTVSGVDRYGDVILTRPTGSSTEQQTLSSAAYQRVVATDVNKKKFVPKPKFKIDQPFFFDKGAVFAKAFDGHRNRALVTGVVNGQAVQEWIDAKLLNNYFINPDGARLDLAQRFGMKPYEEAAESEKKQPKAAPKKTQTDNERKEPTVATTTTVSSEKKKDAPSSRAQTIVEEDEENLRLDTTPEEEKNTSRSDRDQTEITSSSRVIAEGARAMAAEAAKVIRQPAKVLPTAIGDAARPTSSSRPSDPRSTDLRAQQRKDELDFKNGTITKAEYDKRRRHTSDELSYLESEPTNGRALSNDERLQQLRDLHKADVEAYFKGEMTREEYGQRKRSMNNQIAYLEQVQREGRTRNAQAESSRQAKMARMEELKARHKADAEAYLDRKEMSREEYGKRKRSHNDQIAYWEQELAAGSGGKSTEARLAELTAQHQADIAEFQAGKIDKQEYGKRKRSVNDQMQYLKSLDGSDITDLDQQTIRDTRTELRQRYEQRKQSAAQTETTINVQGQMPSVPPPARVSGAGTVTAVADVRLTVRGQQVGFQKRQLVQAGEQHQEQLETRLEQLRERRQSVTRDLTAVNTQIRDTEQLLHQTVRRETGAESTPASNELRSTLQGFRDQRRSLQQEQLRLSADTVHTRRELAAVIVALGYVQGAAQPTPEMYQQLADTVPEPTLAAQASTNADTPSSPNSAGDVVPAPTEPAAPQPRIPLGIPPVAERVSRDDEPEGLSSAPMPQTLRPLPAMQDRVTSASPASKASSGPQDPYEQALAHPKGTGNSPTLPTYNQQRPSNGNISDEEQKRVAFLEQQKQASRNAQQFFGDSPEPEQQTGEMAGDPSQTGLSQEDEEEAHRQAVEAAKSQLKEQARQQRQARTNARSGNQGANARPTPGGPQGMRAPATGGARGVTGGGAGGSSMKSLKAGSAATILLLFILLNIQLLNKIWPKSKSIPPSSIYEDVLIICIDALLAVIVFMVITGFISLMSSAAAIFS